MPEHVVNDLDKLKGIGARYKEMLKSIGVDSIKELSHRNPAHLKQMIEELHGPLWACPSGRRKPGSTKLRPTRSSSTVEDVPC
jgi:hypothetical protein